MAGKTADAERVPRRGGLRRRETRKGDKRKSTGLGGDRKREGVRRWYKGGRKGGGGNGEAWPRAKPRGDQHDWASEPGMRERTH